MLLSYEGSSQPYLDGVGRVVPVTCFVGSRDPGPPASDYHTEAAFAQEADVQRHGPLDLCWVYRLAPTVLKPTGDCEAGDRHKMAPHRLRLVLALEVDAPRWPTNSTTGDTQAYPWRRMRQYRALERGQGTSIVDLYWAGCIINMSGFDLRQAQA